jgi:diguanylate cyclase (GGDEF)-like protein
MMIDADRFKQVNDSYGHLVGDEVIKKIAQILQSIIRPYDGLGRYGGEEFIVVLPDTETGVAVDIGERICRALRSITVSAGDDEIKVTVSAGVASFVDEDRTVSDVIARADKALLEAKVNGRDRVEF